MQEYWSFPYFIYLQVYCNGRPSPDVGRTLAASGIVPIVTMTFTEQYLENHSSNVLHYTMQGALVNADDRDLGTAVLSQPAWLVPLLFDARTRVIPVCVETGSSGYDVQPLRYVTGAPHVLSLALLISTLRNTHVTPWAAI